MRSPIRRIPAILRRRARRHRRLGAVLALCLVVLPFTGFWVGANDMGRGIVGIRLRIDRGAVVPGSVSESSRYKTLAADRTRYRAAIHRPDQVWADSGPAPVSGSLLTLRDGKVGLTLAGEAFLPLPRISSATPSQSFAFWKRNGLDAPDEPSGSRNPSDLRWLTDASWKPGGECLTPENDNLTLDMRRLALSLRMPFTLSAPHPKSGQYMEMIDHSSKRFGLPPQLIYAVMRTESAFNPFAVSNAGALGLMQVVPGTAGHEVQAYLTGKGGAPSSSFLFDPRSNIEYGSAYLHLLATRYFSGVRNQASRELCMIAAYNAGPRAVYRVFSSNPDAAVAAINKLSPDDLFKKLSSSMAAQETRLYIGKVLANINTFPG